MVYILFSQAYGQAQEAKKLFRTRDGNFCTKTNVQNAIHLNGSLLNPRPMKSGELCC